MILKADEIANWLERTPDDPQERFLIRPTPNLQQIRESGAQRQLKFPTDDN